MFVVCIRKGEQIRDGTLIGFLKLNLITHVCTVCVCVGLSNSTNDNFNNFNDNISFLFYNLQYIFNYGRW